MLKLSDLALKPDFQLGPMLVSPARRLVEGPDGSVYVQPLIMQVFLMLLDARGQVVTRNDLFDQVWGGIECRRRQPQSRDRQGAPDRGAGRARAVRNRDHPADRLPADWARSSTSEMRTCATANEHSQFRVSRRVMLGSAAAAGVAAAGGLGLWSVRRSREDRRFNELMELGKQAQLYGDNSDKPSEYFQQAAAMRPDNPKAQGLFALTQAMLAEDGGTQAGAAVQRADRAARAALARRSQGAQRAPCSGHASTIDARPGDQRRPAARDSRDGSGQYRRRWTACGACCSRRDEAAMHLP